MVKEYRPSETASGGPRQRLTMHDLKRAGRSSVGRNARHRHTCCNVLVALDASLNQGQIDVLQWISEGCPADRWTNFTYKTTAAALEWRGLITVSKRGGIWTAAILPAGTHYLATGKYPAGHRLHRVSPPRRTVTTPVVPPRRAPQPSSSAAVKPTYQLVKDIVDAGGVLERDMTDDGTNYKHLVAIISLCRAMFQDPSCTSIWPVIARTVRAAWRSSASSRRRSDSRLNSRSPRELPAHRWTRDRLATRAAMSAPRFPTAEVCLSGLATRGRRRRSRIRESGCS